MLAYPQPGTLYVFMILSSTLPLTTQRNLYLEMT
jgi:hypothetical protein